MKLVELANTLQTWFWEINIHITAQPLLLGVQIADVESRTIEKTR